MGCGNVKKMMRDRSVSQITVPEPEPQCAYGEFTSADGSCVLEEEVCANTETAEVRKTKDLSAPLQEHRQKHPDGERFTRAVLSCCF